MRVETIISLRRSNIAASLLPLTCELSITLQRMVYCIAFGCNNKDGDHKRGVRFHHLPLRNKPLLKQWLTKLRLQNPPVRRSSLVCSEHFEPDCFQRDLQAELLGTKPRIHLKPDAVPTIFTFTSKRKQRSTGQKRRHNQVTIYCLFQSTCHLQQTLLM